MSDGLTLLARHPTSGALTLLAHRGASHAAPENTLAAFARALDVEGADGIELDVRLSADSVPVVFHDSDLARMSGQGGAVAERTAAELATLSLGGEPMPTLAALVDFLAARAPTIVNVELKPLARPDLLAAACRPHLEALARAHRVILSSFDPRVLLRLDGPWARGLLFEDPGALKALPLLPPVDLHPGADLVTAASRAAWSALAPTATWRVWTVDAPAEARRLLALGVTTFITNRPGPLRAELGVNDPCAPA